MADYKIIKFCRLCKAKFVVNKGQSRIIYCDACQTKYNNQNKINEE